MNPAKRSDSALSADTKGDTARSRVGQQYATNRISDTPFGQQSDASLQNLQSSPGSENLMS
jgi:hypothetical protein